MKSSLTTLIALILIQISCLGTAQYPDLLIFNTQLFDLFSNPLESYPWKDGKEPVLFESEAGNSTANWRGYIAVWEIDDKKLYLKAIRAFVDDGWKEIKEEKKKGGIGHLPAMVQKKRPISLLELFGEKVQDGRVFADWFSGRLRIPLGAEIDYVHMGYESVYEKDMFIELSEGLVKNERKVGNQNER